MMALYYFMILLLICGTGVHSDESTLEVGSGDMDTQTTAVPSVNLIDGNGDIVTGIRTSPPDDLKNFTPYYEIGYVTEVNELNSKENLGGELSTLKTNIAEDGEITGIHSQFSTTTTTMAVTDETTRLPAEETSTKYDSTTTTTTTTMATTTTTTAETPIPTVTSATSTEIPTTAFDGTTVSNEKKQTTMSSMKQTTTSSSTTAATEKIDKPTGHSAQTQDEVENEVCVFMSPDFICQEEKMICYGEGEIDCSPLEDSISSPSPKSEDYSVDEDPESATIETFPPNLVGVGTPKKILFYNRQPLTTEGTNETAEKDMHENSEKEASITTTVMVEGESNTPTEYTFMTENDFEVRATAKVYNIETALEMKQTTPAEESSYQTIQWRVLFGTMPPTLSPEMEDTTTNAEFTEETSPTVPTDSDASTTMSNTPATDSDSFIRRRRGISHEGYTPEPHYEELYKKKVENRHVKRGNETCRLIGNIRCNPMPTTIKCVGKTVCQALRIKSEVPEPSQRKGLKVWMIVVIVICGVFGFMTIGLVIYMIVHSFSRRCKKLKVQPAHDVLPLNYMTKKSETVETA